MAACKLGQRARTGRRRAWAVSARWKCGWRRPQPRCARPKNCATAFSTRKVRRSPIRARLLARRDVDAYDAICDHLLVSITPPATGSAEPPRGGRHLSTAAAATGAKNMAASTPPANSTSARCIARHANMQFLELGRSCVLAPYRNKRTVELLWHGISRLHAAKPLRRDVRLRQPRRHRTRSGWRCRCRSCITMRGRRKPGARGRCPSAMSR